MSDTPAMTLDDAIAAFAAAVDEPPMEALRWSLAHWDEAAPHFLALLETYADATEGPDFPADALFFIVHLCGDRGDKRAWRPLCRIMMNEERLLNILGEVAAVETLKRVLIKCFDGDQTPLRTIIESPDAESITRGEAMLVLAWLARDGQIPERAFRDYIGHLFREMLPKEPDYVWYHLVLVAGIMGYREFAGKSEHLVRTGMVPEEWLTLAELEMLLESGDPTGVSGLEGEDTFPFGDVLTELADWPWDEDLEGEEDEVEVQQPMINPLRHVGRNDPCPCGSGKKFKNCHLVAE
jgi:hypothetical protein